MGGAWSIFSCIIPIIVIDFEMIDLDNYHHGDWNRKLCKYLFLVKTFIYNIYTIYTLSNSATGYIGAIFHWTVDKY